VADGVLAARLRRDQPGGGDAFGSRAPAAPLCDYRDRQPPPLRDPGGGCLAAPSGDTRLPQGASVTRGRCVSDRGAGFKNPRRGVGLCSRVVTSCFWIRANGLRRERGSLEPVRGAHAPSNSGGGGAPPRRIKLGPHASKK